MVHVFIVNPICAGVGYTAKLREQLSEIPGLNYYVFTSRSVGYEKELAGIIERAFDGEQLRIYCCGGSGTAMNIINGLSDLSRVEIGLIPLSEMGFLHAFTNSHMFLDITRMIKGDIMHVDYLKVNDEVVLNTVSIGLDAFSKKNDETFKGFRAFGKHAPYIMSFLHTLLLARNHQYVVQTDNDSFAQACTQIAFSNVPVLANTIIYSEDKDITDGMGTYMIADAVLHIKRFAAIKRLMKLQGKQEHDNPDITVGESSSITIRRVGGMSFWCCLDGELRYYTECKAEVVRQGLKMIIPRGVEYEQR